MPVNSNAADCVELQKLRSMAVYFLHNKEKTQSYYNLDVRHLNGTQRRVRSRDLPWNMKQVSYLEIYIYFKTNLKDQVNLEQKIFLQKYCYPIKENFSFFSGNKK